MQQIDRKRIDRKGNIEPCSVSLTETLLMSNTIELAEKTKNIAATFLFTTALITSTFDLLPYGLP